MPDADLPPFLEAAECQKTYLTEDAPATPSLSGILRERIRQHGPLGFPEFMTAALYESGLGYYARGTRQVGRGGDFFTSVSVGPLFGELLARRFLRDWQQRGEPPQWRIIECGAHDGTLASDVLGALRRLQPSAYEGLEYAIPEPLPTLQAAQRWNLSAFSGRVNFIKHPEELAATPMPGVVFGNELLDALSFHVVERRTGQWLECAVQLDANDAFTWQMREIHDPALTAALARLRGDFPEGYRTEVRTQYAEFLAPFTQALTDGLMLWPDYGFTRNDYYHLARSTGTIRTFCKHNAGENPLLRPGEMDITAHVDFTAVAEAAIALGGKPLVFQSQGTWLTGIARDWLIAQEGNPQHSLLRQFQTLTHPTHLGRSFHVLELSWNPAATTDGPLNGLFD